MTDLEIFLRSQDHIRRALTPPTREEVERSLRIIAEASARTERAARRDRIRRLLIEELADVATDIEMRLRATLARRNERNEK
jgi:hypothetical protein